MQQITKIIALVIVAVLASIAVINYTVNMAVHDETYAQVNYEYTLTDTSTTYNTAPYALEFKADHEGFVRVYYGPIGSQVPSDNVYHRGWNYILIEKVPTAYNLQPTSVEFYDRC